MDDLEANLDAVRLALSKKMLQAHSQHSSIGASAPAEGDAMTGGEHAGPLHRKVQALIHEYERSGTAQASDASFASVAAPSTPTSAAHPTVQLRKAYVQTVRGELELLSALLPREGGGAGAGGGGGGGEGEVEVEIEGEGEGEGEDVNESSADAGRAAARSLEQALEHSPGYVDALWLLAWRELHVDAEGRRCRAAPPGDAVRITIGTAQLECSAEAAERAAALLGQLDTESVDAGALSAYRAYVLSCAHVVRAQVLGGAPDGGYGDNAVAAATSYGEVLRVHGVAVTGTTVLRNGAIESRELLAQALVALPSQLVRAGRVQDSLRAFRRCLMPRSRGTLSEILSEQDRNTLLQQLGRVLLTQCWDSESNFVPAESGDGYASAREEALLVLQLAARHSPVSAVDLAVALCRTGRCDSACALLEEQLGSQAPNSMLWWQTGLMLQQAGQSHLAINALTQCHRQLLLEAAAETDDDAASPASSEWSILPRHAPSTLACKIRLQQSRVAASAPARAEEGLALQFAERALATLPQPYSGTSAARCLLMHGRALAISGRELPTSAARATQFAQAREAFQQCLALNAGSGAGEGAARHNIALLLAIDGQIGPAYDAVKHALAEGHGHMMPALQNLAAMLLCTAQHTDLALRLCCVALEEFPDDFSLLLTRARIERVLDAEAALLTLERVVQLLGDGRYSTPDEQCSTALLGGGVSAEHSINVRQEHAPLPCTIEELVEFWCFFAMTCTENGLLAEGMNKLRLAREVARTSSKAHLNAEVACFTAELHLANGDAASAEKQFAMALAVCPHYAPASLGMGKLHLARAMEQAREGAQPHEHDRDDTLHRARGFLMAATTFDANSHEAQVALGHALQELELAEDASEALLRALELERILPPRSWNVVPFL